MKRRILSILITLCMISTISPVAAHAATSGTLYKGFTEITNASGLNDGTKYYFSTTSYASGDAVLSLTGVSARLTMTSTENAAKGLMYADISQNPQKYYLGPTGIDQGPGFDADPGGLYYGAVNYAGMQGTPGTGWYFWCIYGGVDGLGPYHAYDYSTATFIASDVTVTANRSFGTTDTIAKSDLTVKVLGYNVTDYTITDSSVSASDRTYTLDVGGVSVDENAGFIITFTKDPNSTGTTTTTVKNTGVTIYVPYSDGTYSGHTFKGWTLTQNSSTVNYLPGSEFNVDANTTLYAVWEPIVYYTVTINGVGQQVASGSTAIAPSDPTKATNYYNSSDTLIVGADDSTPAAIKKITYAFVGWKNNATNQIWDFSTPVTSAVTLVPSYSETVYYKVSFDKNNANSSYTATRQWIIAGGHVAEVSAPSTVTSGSPATNYYFIGWNTSQNGSGEYWNYYGDVVNNDLTLYAQWNTVDSYNITFDDNITDPKDDYVWNTGSLIDNGVASTGYVSAPAIHRVDYVFDGWYTDTNCNASNAYNTNRTLSENNISGLDTDHDKGVTLYAKWTPKYYSENDILIASTSLDSGKFANAYSNYINAFENNSSYNTPDATKVYRNFFLVNVNGTLVTPSTLPAGLYLNSRTGEVYGVPDTAGDYSFYVRIANDEGRWISTTYPITLTISKAPVSVDMKDDNAGLSKIYGSNDPGFYSDQLTITAISTSGITYYDNNSNVDLAYNYAAIKSTRASNEATFSPANAATLIYAPDLNDLTHVLIPNTQSLTLSMVFIRTSGEDNGAYKLSLDADHITGTDLANYNITIANALHSAALTYSEDTPPAVTTAAEYVFSISAKSGASYSNSGNTVVYGTYASGDDIKAKLTNGSGLVSNGAISVTDAFQSVVLTTSSVSTSGKINVGTYNTGFTPIIVNTAENKGTSREEGATTTANYSSPSFSITVTAKALTTDGKTLSQAINSSFTSSDLSKLISLDSVAGDEVGLTINSLTIGSTTYDLANDTERDAANAALADFMKTAGSHTMTIGYSNILTGSDAGNYRIIAGTVTNAILDVYNVSSGGGGIVPENFAKAITDGQTYDVGIMSETKTETIVTVDNDKFGKVLSNTNVGGEIIIPVSSGTDAAVVSLKVKQIEDMATEGITLNIIAGDVQYKLDTTAIDTKSILKGLGAMDPSLVTFQVRIITPDIGTQNQIKSKISVDGATIVGKALEFQVIATYNGKSYAVTNFNKYITRSIEITAAQAAKTTTAIIYSADGSYYHVPTYIRQVGSKYYADVHSLTNSTYVLINHPKSFNDTNGKWFKKTVSEMASRDIIDGYKGDIFKGNDNITRGEFAAILIRALGLDPEQSKAAGLFKDVKSGNWYFGEVGMALEHGIIKGKSATTFVPNSNITRQEAMQMIKRASEITGLAEGSKNYKSLTGLNEASSWAVDGVVFNLKTGLIQGNSQGYINPRGNISRAETATIVMRMLQMSKLIDIRK